MYRDVVTETSPDRNGSDRKVLFRDGAVPAAVIWNNTPGQCPRLGCLAKGAPKKSQEIYNYVVSESDERPPSKGE